LHRKCYWEVWAQGNRRPKQDSHLRQKHRQATEEAGLVFVCQVYRIKVETEVVTMVSADNVVKQSMLDEIRAIEGEKEVVQAEE